MDDWTQSAMWWHVYPLGFVGAPVRPATPETVVTHRLDRIEAWLDHLVALGLNGLLLGPVFASESHGYDTVDYFHVDPRLGDEDDLRRLIDAARARGIRVLLDGVFNHVGRTHPAFRALEQDGPAAATVGLFRVRWHDGGEPGMGVDADVFEGHQSLVALDHTSKAVEDLVFEVMTYWLDRGIDGWRLDAAYAVPTEFWSRVLPRVREAHPGAWFLGEVIHGDASRIVSESTMDSLTQYELWQGIWHAIADRNLFELKHALERHDALLATFVPQTFVGNHDVTRIASAIGAEFVPHALAVQYGVAGIPSVYAGDEYGYAGVKEQRMGGDDAVRPEFPSLPPAPETLEPATARILQTHRALIAMRRRRPWLWRAHTDVIGLDNTSIAMRTASGPDAIVVALNLAGDPVTLPIADAREVVVGDATVSGSDATLPPRGFAVLSS